MTEERWLIMPATQVKNHTQDQSTTLIVYVPADFIEAWRNGSSSTPAVPPAPTGPASGTAAGGSGVVEPGPHGRGAYAPATSTHLPGVSAPARRSDTDN